MIKHSLFHRAWFARCSCVFHLLLFYTDPTLSSSTTTHTCSDLDCKLKSAAQTPAAMHNNLHNNVPEILGRSSVNSSQMYYKTVSAHFASCIIILIFKIVSQSHRFGVWLNSILDVCEHICARVCVYAVYLLEPSFCLNHKHAADTHIFSFHLLSIDGKALYSNIPTHTVQKTHVRSTFILLCARFTVCCLLYFVRF